MSQKIKGHNLWVRADNFLIVVSECSSLFNLVNCLAIQVLYFFIKCRKIQTASNCLVDIPDFHKTLYSRIPLIWT